MLQLNFLDAFEPAPIQTEHREISFDPKTCPRDQHGRPVLKIPAYGVPDYEFAFCEWEGKSPVISTTAAGQGVTIYPCNGGFGAYTQTTEGTPCFSGTGFRSWTNCGTTTNDPAACVDMIESYINSPRRSDMAGGLGGKLEPWWSHTVSQWRGSLQFELELGPRSEIWNQWEEEKPGTHAQLWKDFDEKEAAALQYMADHNINPLDVIRSGRKLKAGKTWPSYQHTGKTWKRIDPK